MAGQSLRLTIDLVPETCWYSSLYRKIPRSKWNKLRKGTYTEVGHACKICGAKGRLNCHETWEYDDSNSVQTLKSFVALCSMCHHVKHFGRTQLLASEGKLDLDSVINHFCKVNNVSRDVFRAHKIQAFSAWRERSEHKWETDLGKWSKLVDEKTA